MLLKLLPIKSVIDFGCGRGEWLSKFKEHGVTDIRGIDGAHFDQGKLLIPKEAFTAYDLECLREGPFALDRAYEMALNLEVAEHLTVECAGHLVESLVKAAPLILFSAAIPGQGGVNHVNEQWPSFWRQQFSRWEYRLFDPVRRFIYGERRIPWWYRQNLVLYASRSAVTQYSALSAMAIQIDDPVCEWIHVTNSTGK